MFYSYYISSKKVIIIEQDLLINWLDWVLNPTQLWGFQKRFKSIVFAWFLMKAI